MSFVLIDYGNIKIHNWSHQILINQIEQPPVRQYLKERNIFYLDVRRLDRTILPFLTCHLLSCPLLLCSGNLVVKPSIVAISCYNVNNLTTTQNHGKRKPNVGFEKYVEICPHIADFLEMENISSFTGFCPWENVVYLFAALSKCEDFTNGNHQ